MKLFYILLIAPIWAAAQQDSVISYNGIETVDSATKDQLFANARQWMNVHFVSSKAVIQVADKETGELSGKGILTNIPVTVKYLGSHTSMYNSDVLMNFKFKDGKYKFEFTNFLVYEGDHSEYSLGPLTSGSIAKDKWSMVSQKKMNEIYASAKEGVEVKINELIASLKETMRKPTDNF